MQTENNQPKRTKKHLPLLLIVVVIIAALAGYKIYQNSKMNDALTAALAKSDEETQDLSRQPSALEGEEGYVLTGVLSPIHSYSVAAKVGGQVQEVAVEKGVPVKMGDILVRQDATDVQLTAGQGSTTDELLQRLQETYQLAEDTYQKNKSLYDQGVIAESVLRQSQTQRDNAKLQYEGTANSIAQQTAKTIIKSPGDGIVTGLTVQVGDYLAAGAQVASVIDISQLILKGTVPESILQQIKEGQKVSVQIESLDKTVDGVITFVSPAAVSSGQMFPVEITITNDQQAIKAGMSALTTLGIE